MVKNIFIIALLISFLSFVTIKPENFKTHNTFLQSVPDTINWKLLGVINYKKKPHKDFPEGVLFPKVNATLKMLKGKKVILTGFIVPIDNTSYALSKTVFASCFFCGKAGPETIAGLKFKGKTPKLKTDTYATIEGTFRYNETDVDDWIYHLDDAVIVKTR
ncbi:MAG: hypothetical protein ACOVQ2_02805 [Flavobacterium sp.]|jgi:hypothetical protein